jgi:hypothetical protein
MNDKSRSETADPSGDLPNLPRDRRRQPVTAFTTKDDMKAYLKRMRGTFNRPLVCRIDGDGHAPVIMTLTIAMGE